MALNVKVQLSNSEGLFEIIVFEGLSHWIVVHPTIHGEPLLTSQAFYYLEQLESVAEIRFETKDDQLSEGEMGYLIDNYLYEYSKINNRSKISTKVTQGKYWIDDPSELYAFYDQKNTEALVLDILNDESVHSISSLDADVDFSDWCVIKNYSDQIFYTYLSSMQPLIDKKVAVFVTPSSERDGYMGKARLVKCGYGLVDFYQAQQLDNLSIRDIKADATHVEIDTSSSAATLKTIPIRRVALQNKYNPTMLAYYFSGLKEHNPLFAFVGFYNAIEYYFEEAPMLLDKTAKTELEQIKCVIELLANNNDISVFIAALDRDFRKKLHQNIKTSSGIEISGFAPPSINEFIIELGRWLYEIRCAIVHSKKTRRGKHTAIFEPYSPHADNIEIAVPIVKWLAILCIEKDFNLGGYDQWSTIYDSHIL
jgi:hypothetical protein